VIVDRKERLLTEYSIFGSHDDKKSQKEKKHSSVNRTQRTGKSPIGFSFKEEALNAIFKKNSSRKASEGLMISSNRSRRNGPATKAPKFYLNDRNVTSAGKKMIGVPVDLNLTSTIQNLPAGNKAIQKKFLNPSNKSNATYKTILSNLIIKSNRKSSDLLHNDEGMTDKNLLNLGKRIMSFSKKRGSKDRSSNNMKQINNYLQNSSFFNSPTQNGNTTDSIVKKNNISHNYINIDA
jgi:hypothetical protein